MEDKADFDRLFRKHYAELFIFAHRMVWDEEECHDIVTERFEALWAHYKDIDGETVRAWLYRTVRNACLDFLEHERHEKNYADLYRHITSGIEDTDWLAHNDERTKAIRTIFSQMDEKTRTIFYACYVERRKYKEVADQMGISPDTVKKYVMRALKIVREYKQKLNKQ